MKNSISFISYIFISSFLFASLSCNRNSSGQLKSLYEEIDLEMDNIAEYDAQKEKKIQDIKRSLIHQGNPELRREITDFLITEYEAYISDSALYYINQNLQNPVVTDNPRLETFYLIKKADVSAHAGLFNEAGEILDQIESSSLDSILLEDYYSAYCDLHQYQSEYSSTSEFARKHEELRELYIDSMSRVAPVTSFNYLTHHTAETARRGNYKEAEKILLENLKKYSSGDRKYSIIASILADVYHQENDKENFHKYLALSALSDIRGAVKENMALRALATQCYEAGDMERAERYLRQSFADANFYVARMRNAQSSQMIPFVGEAYRVKMVGLNHKLTVMVVFMSLLALGFILISIFAFLQVKKVREVNQKTKFMLEEMSELSAKLKDVNEELVHTNLELQSSNKIKEQYAALFMEYASLAYQSLQQYQQSLKIAASQGNIKQLLKKIEFPAPESKSMAEFYAKFDEAILNLYPSFVDNFNALLKEGAKVEPEGVYENGKEKLNTELRVFALIRIGINDSEKIAKFLRCSLATVYTYRSRMKKKAIDPSSFEESLSAL